MNNILRYIATLLVSIASSSYTIGDKLRFDAGMGIGLSAPSISVPSLGTQLEEQQVGHGSRQLTRFEQGIVKKAVEKIEDAFKKADSQGRAAAYNLLRLPIELQVRILDNLTAQERSDIAEMSKDHEELIEKYNKQRIEHLAKMRTELRYLGPLTVDNISKLGKAFPNIKKLTISTVGVNSRTDEAITSAFPHLELIILLDCNIDHYIVEIVFNEWKKDKSGRTVLCIPRNNRRPKHFSEIIDGHIDWWGYNG